jgi:hypothetical protein
MNRNHRCRFTWLITGLLALAASLAALPAGAQSSMIEGSWKLVSRTLPDGTMVTAPNLQGLLTFSKGYRHISVVFKTPDGKLGSFSALAAYKISKKEYNETRLYRVFDDPASGKGIDYQTTGATRSEPIQKRGRSVRIKAPFDPVTWTFEGNTMKATADGGEFTDTWEKVN